MNSEFRCPRRSHERSDHDACGYPSEVKQPGEDRELSWQWMPRKAGCKNEPDDSRVCCCNLDRDWSGKRFTENNEAVVWDALSDVGDELIVTERTIDGVTDELNWTMRR